VYTRRNHALSGERLALDVDNAFYAVAESLIPSFQEQNDYEGFKLACIIHFGIDTQIPADNFAKTEVTILAEQLYNEAKASYLQKMEHIKKEALPVFQNIMITQGRGIENVFVPFVDNKKAIQVLTDLNKTIDSKGQELINALERTITLAFIDDAWKDHLRSMDDLRTSVQNATYEQKDPLVIYKVEAFNLFAQLNNEINKNIVAFLCHASIHAEQQPIREGRAAKTDMSKMKQRKDGLQIAGSGGEAPEYHDPSAQEKQEPVIVGPKIGRNDLCPCGSGKKFKSCHGKEG
jgi:preprotein translocase subunit SecA